ncbi:MAG: hypothetical protein H0W86_05835 [Armatimonadetes bacterium]|nr:hypothetical protein [Armatimonadota bacterium]
MNSRIWIIVCVGLAAIALLTYELGSGIERRQTDEEADWDEIDEASDGSFPASDAPSWTPVKGVGDV